jgi:hypothetical protein
MSPLALLVALQGIPAAPPPPEVVPVVRYGDRGTSHIGLILGLGSVANGVRWAGGIDYAYFVADGIAPGLETQVSGGTGLLTTGMALGTVRLVPVRAPAFSIFLLGRAGRLLVSGHDDGWAAGAGAGIIFFPGGRIGLQLAYDILRLLPHSFCGDLSGGCVVQGLQAGLVAAF